MFNLFRVKGENFRTEVLQSLTWIRGGIPVFCCRDIFLDKMIDQNNDLSFRSHLF